MDRENADNNQVRPRWAIDLDWYQQNNRSFSTLAQSRLCSRCRNRFKARKSEASVTDILAAIKGCCAKEPGFITRRMSILESVFRLFLLNGNQPLDAEEISRQITERRGGDPYRASADILTRILASDQYYGLRQVAS